MKITQEQADKLYSLLIEFLDSDEIDRQAVKEANELITAINDANHVDEMARIWEEKRAAAGHSNIAASGHGSGFPSAKDTL